VIHIRALKCFASWVAIGAIELDQTPDFINHLFSVLGATEVRIKTPH